LKSKLNKNKSFFSYAKSCGLERAFLFDVASKIFIASDSINPLDAQLYELCCDKIDLVLDISNIYA